MIVAPPSKVLELDLKVMVQSDGLAMGGASGRVYCRIGQ